MSIWCVTHRAARCVRVVFTVDVTEDGVEVVQNDESFESVRMYNTWARAVLEAVLVFHRCSESANRSRSDSS